MIHQTIPVDILMEVLSRLPGKSVIRFRCVSKYWCSLITHPYFVDLYLSRSHVRDNGVFLVIPPLFGYSSVTHPFYNFYIIDLKKNPMELDGVSFHKPSLSFTPDRVTNMVNGLVCSYCAVLRGAREVSIYNLTTRENVPLPSPPRRGPPVIRRYYLGFDPTNKEYKLVNTYWTDGDTIDWMGCEVLTVKGNDSNTTWRPIDISHVNVTADMYPREDGFCHDGVLYWSWCDFQSESEEKGIIIAFSVAHEKFDYFDYPPEAMPIDGVSICQVRGHVSVLVIPHNSYNEILITLWRFMDREDNGKSSWTKEVITCPFHIYLDTPLTCRDFGVVYRLSSSMTDLVTIDCYDLTTKEQTVLQVNNARRFLCSSRGFEPSVMVENIMPLKSNNWREGHCLDDEALGI